MKPIEYSVIVDLAHKKMIEELTNSTPVDFKSLLDINVFRECQGVITEYPTLNVGSLAFKLGENSNLLTYLALVQAIEMQEQGIQIPQNLLNPVGFEFLATLYILDREVCYVEQALPNRTEKLFMKGNRTAVGKNKLYSLLSEFRYPTLTLDTAETFDENFDGEKFVITKTNSIFDFKAAQAPFYINDNGEITLPFVGDAVPTFNICPWRTLVKLYEVYKALFKSAVYTVGFLKSDHSYREYVTSLNSEILNKVWNNSDRVNLSLSNSLPVLAKGYFHVPDLKLPVDDKSQVRAVNVLKILSLERKKQIRKSDFAVSNVDYTNARYAIYNILKQRGEAAALIIKHLRNIIPQTAGDGITKYDPKTTLELSIKEFGRLCVTNKSVELDMECFLILKEVFKEEAEKVMNTNKQFDDSTYIDYTEEFLASEDKVDMIERLANENVLRVEYVKKDKSSSRRYLTLSTDITDKVIGTDWRSDADNMSIYEQLMEVKSILDVIKSSTSAQYLYESFAKRLGIDISVFNGDLMRIRRELIIKGDTLQADMMVQLEKWQVGERNRQAANKARGNVKFFDLSTPYDLLELTESGTKTIKKFFTVENFTKVGVVKYNN